MDADRQDEVTVLWQMLVEKSRFLRFQRQRAMEVLLCGRKWGNDQPADDAQRLSAADIERGALCWSGGIPASPEIRAMLAQRLTDEYVLAPADMPLTCQALSLDNALVADAYQQIYDRPLQHLFSSTAAEPTSQPLPPLEQFPAQALQALEAALEYQHLAAGTVLFSTGQPANGLIVICDGLVRAADRPGQPGLGRNDLAGEAALFPGGSYATTLVAVCDTQLFRLSRPAFEQLTEHYPRLALTILRTVAQRLTAVTCSAPQSRSNTTIAILPAGSNANPALLGAGFAHALTVLGRVLHLNSAGVDAALGKGAAQASPGSRLEAHVDAWLSQCEGRHDVVLYEADRDLSVWTQRCIRQAHRVLLVGSADEAAQPNAVDNMLFNVHQSACVQQKDLVLLHPQASVLPQGTTAWLQDRPVTRSYHLALDTPVHFARLVRGLFGQPVALVLSGGGLRGLAQVGVLRALREAHIPVDVVCANSIGALVGALVAMGKDDRELEHLANQFFSDSRLLSDYTLPIASLVAGKRMNNLLEQLFGDIRVEDLWLKYLSTALDLTAAAYLTLQSGLVRRNVRASISMPGMLPPVISDDRHLLVDGGLINNVPVNPLLENLPACRVILVDVTRAFYKADEPYNYGESLPFWKVLNGCFNPFAKKLVLPNIYRLLLRCMEFGTKSGEAAQIARTDLYIRPAVEHIPQYGKIANYQSVIEAGYVAAQQALQGCEQRGKLICDKEDT